MKFVIKVKAIFFLSVFLLVISSCSHQSDKLSQEDIEIISRMIDEFAILTPPPPGIGTADTIVSSKIVDSLLEVKIKVAIYPILESSLDSIGLKKVPKLFEELVDESLPSKTISKHNSFFSQKGHDLMLADISQMRQSYDFEGFDILFRFSNIWYNSNKTKAIFELGISKSHLNGYAMIFCLSKESDGWKITSSIPTSEW